MPQTVNDTTTRLRRASSILAGFACALMLSACATSNAPSAANRPIPPAPNSASSSQAQATTMAAVDAGTPDIIVAATKGVEASWSSITESPLMRAGAELSNLGGAPIVLGTVAGMLIADAKPKGRAARSARALNSAVDTRAVDRAFAAKLEEQLDDIDARIMVRDIQTTADLPDNAYVVASTYTLAQDGSAIRVKTNVTHSAVLAYIAAVQEAERKLQLAREGFGHYSPRRERKKIEQARARVLAAPRYSGAFVYHSDPIALPDLGELPEESLRAEMRAKIVAALDAEREAQILAANNRHAADIASNPSERALKKAEKRRTKALAKAEKLYAESLEKAGDDEFNKMERMVLGLEQWIDTDGGQTLLQATLEDAHDFIVDSISGALEAVPSSAETQLASEKVEPQLNFIGGETVQMLDQNADGRAVVRVQQGPKAGLIMSVPEDGVAEYGGSSVEAK